MRALVLGNEGDCDPGLVGARAEFHGYDLDVHLREHPGNWPSLDGVDLLISLGSEWSVYWNDVQRFVQPELAVLCEAHRRDIPVFGICFGSQLLARAHGGTVGKSARPEIGWFSVMATDAGEGFVDDGPWFQWHDDCWELPIGARLLAANGNANQAFSLGRSFATQFHPELTESVLRRWIGGGGDAVMIQRSIDPEAVIAATINGMAAAEERTNTLFDRFLKVVAQ